MKTDVQSGKSGNTPRLVVRGVDSQPVTEVSVDWMRISFLDKYLQKVVDVTRWFFKSEPELGYGFWGYDRAYIWPNGVRIIYDTDTEKADFHNHRIYFECPGRCCNELTPSDLCLLMQIFKDFFEGRGERVDVCLDDYSRRIAPQELVKIAKRSDYSRFRQFHPRQSYDFGNQLVYDAVVFGSLKKGWVKQLEVYDKGLESKGEKNAIRWEAKFAKDKADKVFRALAGTCGNLDAFALLCGSIVVGSIDFIHRKEGVKNLNRLVRYKFWESLQQGLDGLRIRSAKKVNSVTGVIEWIKRQVAPNLSCLWKLFGSEKEAFSWFVDLLDDGEKRMNENQLSIVRQYEGSFSHRSFMNQGELDNRYLNAMCSLKT